MAAGMGTGLAKGPTTELGGSGSSFQVAGWNSFIDESEQVPELAWPNNVLVYDRMLTDSQVLGLYIATCLPLLDFVWWVEPGDADPELSQALADDLGLPLGEPEDDYEPNPGPGLFRFNFVEHLSEALLAVAFGHYYFEQVGVVDGGLWRLQKLGPRAPQTIAEFKVARDGGLEAIRQRGAVVSQRGQAMYAGLPQPIPVDRLVAYVWQGDARSRWTGRSMLRSLFRHWLVKDRLIRVDAINHERAGGVPWVKTDETYVGASLVELQQLASQFRVGEEAGAAFPPGAELMLARAGGTDVIASVRYHDEAMARVWQAMVVQLGQTQTGSRALGDTFAGLQSAARMAIARWFRGVFREHVIEDWWTWNQPTGARTAHPVLSCRPPGQAPPPGSAPAPAPAQEGAPPDPQVAAAGNPSPRAAPAARRRGADVAAAGARLPARDLRRQPTDAEHRAAVDFASIDLAYESAAAGAEDLWLARVLPGQIAAVADAITFTKKGDRRQRVTRTGMAAVRAPAAGAEELADLLLPAVRAGAEGAMAEAAAQGVLGLEMPSDEALRALVADHAAAVAVQAADGLSLAASRKAVQLAQGRTVAEVASEVTAYLAGLKHQWTVDQLHGATQMALNAGRFAVMEQVPEDTPKSFVASELLDAVTCPPCAAVDGREFATLAEAMRFYASGGYVDCQGGPRCRGTAVGVYDEL